MTVASTKKRVGILRGGKGEDYARSVKYGGELIIFIIENLEDKYKPLDILVDQEGAWHLGGIPIAPADLPHKVDLVWNTAHPEFSVILTSLSIPVVGQPHFSSSLNRDLLRKHLQDIGGNMPRVVRSPQSAREVFEKFSSPWIVRSGNEVCIAQTFPELAELLEEKGDVIVEEFISGKPSAVHTVSGFRGQDVYVLPSGNFSASEKEKIISFARDLHKHLGVNHYLKSDFVLHPKRGFFVTNIYFSPDLRYGSHFHQAAESLGAKMHHLVEHIIEKALV